MTEWSSYGWNHIRCSQKELSEIHSQLKDNNIFILPAAAVKCTFVLSSIFYKIRIQDDGTVEYKLCNDSRREALKQIEALIM